MVNLGYQSDTPGKREPQLTNCLYQLVQWVRLRGIFLLPGPLWVVPFLGRWTWVAHFSKPVVSSIPPGSPSISVPNLCVPALADDGLSDGLVPRRVIWSHFFLFQVGFDHGGLFIYFFVFCFLNHKYRKKIRLYSPNRTERFSPGTVGKIALSLTLLFFSLSPQWALFQQVVLLPGALRVSLEPVTAIFVTCNQPQYRSMTLLDLPGRSDSTWPVSTLVTIEIYLSLFFQFL